MNLRTTKHRVFVLILLALLAGGLACTAWGSALWATLPDLPTVTENWPGCCRRTIAAAVHASVKHLSQAILARHRAMSPSHSGRNRWLVSDAHIASYVRGSFLAPGVHRLRRPQKASVFSFFLFHVTYTGVDKIRTYGKGNLA